MSCLDPAIRPAALYTISEWHTVLVINFITVAPKTVHGAVFGKRGFLLKWGKKITNLAYFTTISVGTKYDIFWHLTIRVNFWIVGV